MWRALGPWDLSGSLLGYLLKGTWSYKWVIRPLIRVIIMVMGLSKWLIIGVISPLSGVILIITYL